MSDAIPIQTIVTMKFVVTTTSKYTLSSGMSPLNRGFHILFWGTISATRIFLSPKYKTLRIMPNAGIREINVVVEQNAKRLKETNANASIGPEDVVLIPYIQSGPKNSQKNSNSNSNVYHDYVGNVNKSNTRIKNAIVDNGTLPAKYQQTLKRKLSQLLDQ